MLNLNLSDMIPLELLKPTYSKVDGVPKKTYPEKGEVFFGSFRTFGGTENLVDGLLVVTDTATIHTWFRPDIKSDCMIRNGNDVFDIIGSPENVSQRNQFLIIKVQRHKGGA